MLDLVFKNFTKDRNISSAVFLRIIRKTASILNLGDRTIGLSINIVGEAKIRSLNAKYRNKKEATDVLSFPVAEKELEINIGKESAKGDIIDLGDIFICLPVAKKYASQEQISLNSKLIFLVIHGFLHLLGYDHEKTKKEKDKMFALQDKIFKYSVCPDKIS